MQAAAGVANQQQPPQPPAPQGQQQPPVPPEKFKANNSHRYHLLHSRDSNNREPQDLLDQQRTWRLRIHNQTLFLHWPQH